MEEERLYEWLRLMPGDEYGEEKAGGLFAAEPNEKGSASYGEIHDDIESLRLLLMGVDRS